MYYRPFLVNGEVPKDLYFVSVDAYKVDKAQKDVTDKHSLYSAQVWMRSNTITPYPNQKLLVCEYIGRLDTMEPVSYTHLLQISFLILILTLILTLNLKSKLPTFLPYPLTNIRFILRPFRSFLLQFSK